MKYLSLIFFAALLAASTLGRVASEDRSMQGKTV